MIIADGVEFWHTPAREAFASIEVRGHVENWPIKGEIFRDWLAGEYYACTERAPAESAVKEVLATLAARAMHAGQEHEVYLRAGAVGNEIYIDLGDADWRAIRVYSGGWEVVQRPPVKFRRSSGLRALPVPQPEATVDDLREMINVSCEGDFKLIVAWLVTALSPSVPCPILVINGEEGSAKSTLTELLRRLVDNYEILSSSAPKDEEDLGVMAHNSRLLVFDNLSGIPNWFSDALCRAATGAGYASRKRFTDRDLNVFRIKCPVILNGIPDLARRSDLVSRCIVITLPAIAKGRRRTISDFWEVFDRRQAFILGALLDGVASALRRQSSTHIENLPRMAEFARWASAAEQGLGWRDGDLLEAYNLNLAKAVEAAIDADPFALAVLKLVDRGDFQGTAHELLRALDEFAGLDAQSRHWPKANGLKDALTRAAVALRSQGIAWEAFRSPTKDRARMISIKRSSR